MNKAVAKLSLSKALDKYNWIVGTGFYIDDIEAQLAAQRTIAEQGITFCYSTKSINFTVGAVVYHRGDRHCRQPDIPAAGSGWCTPDDIAHGEGDLTRRLHSTSKDEVGELSRAFNHFVERVQGVVAQVGITSQHVFEVSDGLKASWAIYSADAGSSS